MDAELPRALTRAMATARFWTGVEMTLGTHVLYRNQ